MIVAKAAGRPRERFCLHGTSPPVALDVHLEDGGVVDKPVDGGQRHGGVREDPCSIRRRAGCRDQDRPPLIAGRDQLEQHAGLGLILGDVGEVVEDQEIELVELGDGVLELKFSARDLQLLDQIRGAGEQDAPAVLDQRQTDGCGEMTFATARRAEHQHVGALGQPAVPGGLAMTCAFEIMGTASKAKLSRVFPGGRWPSAK